MLSDVANLISALKAKVRLRFEAKGDRIQLQYAGLVNAKLELGSIKLPPVDLEFTSLINQSKEEKLILTSSTPKWQVEAGQQLPTSYILTRPELYYKNLKVIVKMKGSLKFTEILRTLGIDLTDNKKMKELFKYESLFKI
jgi:hypothetical protein